MDHLVGFRVSAFKLSPSVDVEWLFKFIIKILGFLLLLKIFFLKEINFSLEVRDAGCFVLGNDQLSFQFSNMLSKLGDIIKSLFIVDFTLV